MNKSLLLSYETLDSSDMIWAISTERKAPGAHQMSLC